MNNKNFSFGNQLFKKGVDIFAASMKLPLSKKLLDFLKEQGYTHLQLRGIEKKPEDRIDNPGFPADDYILIPWKQGISLFEEADMRMEEIDSTDITDMLNVELGIIFYVEVETGFATQYSSPNP